jgi:hypothetical protein
MPDALSIPTDEHGGAAVSRVQQSDSGLSDDDGTPQMTGRSSSLFGGRARMDPPIATRVERRATLLPPSATGAGTRIGSAPMGGRTPAKDLWGDGMISEVDRGGAYDY